MFRKIFAAMLTIAIMLTTAVFAEGGAIADNTLECDINGEHRIFYLSLATIVYDEIIASYVSFDPRGEVEMSLAIVMDYRITPGTYDDAGDNMEIKRIVLDTDGVVNAFGNVNFQNHYAVGNAPYKKNITNGVDFDFYVNYSYSDEVSFILRIDERSSDWMTYSGVFAANLDSAYDDTYFELSGAAFNFTIGEKHTGINNISEDEEAIPSVSLDDLPF